MAGPEPLLRPVRPTDAKALGDFYEGLSPGSRHLRFHGMGHLSEADLAGFAAADGRRIAGWVATVDGMIVGHVILSSGPEAAVMEIGVAVADAFQGRRIGTRLCELAVDWAAGLGVRQIVAPVLWGNAAMEHLARHLGRARCTLGTGLETFIVELPSSVPESAGPDRHP